MFVKAGLRAKEISSLTWNMITRADGQVGDAIALENRASKGKGGGLTPNTVTVWFHTLYHTLGLTGCSSYSGRRTFITRAAKKVVEAGGSLRDVQRLAGHSSLPMTQRYIEGDADAKRKLVNLI